MMTDQINSPQEIPPEQIDRVMTIIIQIQDEKKAVKALSQLGIKPVQFSTSGGFLGRQNVTLFMGMPAKLIDAALNVLERTCQKRTEYVSTPLEGTPLPIPLSTPIVVGGATIFVFTIDRFEEL
jgi:uncharacterized protein YaaQ